MGNDTNKILAGSVALVLISNKKKKKQDHLLYQVSI